MKITELFTSTSREVGQSDISRNAQLLTRAGYVDRLMAGVYSYLPLGLRTLNKIEGIMREEMSTLGAQEVLLPALQPKELWQKTGRWDSVDVLYKLNGGGGAEPDLTLGPTHEEVVTPVVTRFVRSYRDLPRAVFQIQTKFRNEARAKSGLLRGREFRMKDMYSFHSNQQDLDAFYDRTTDAYKRIYDRCGLGSITLTTFASGGVFSKYSHEFQALASCGEDLVYRIPGTQVAINKEIIGDVSAMRNLIPGFQLGDEVKLDESRAIEVGNIFKLGTRYTAPFGGTYTNQAGHEEPILMGCYGAGPSRLMGAIAECLSDNRGLRWPVEVAPFQVQLISLSRSEGEREKVDEMYNALRQNKIDVLYDDRHELRAGEKFADADLIGIPYRVVVSSKTLQQSKCELKARDSEETRLCTSDDLCRFFGLYQSPRSLSVAPL